MFQTEHHFHLNAKKMKRNLILKIASIAIVFSSCQRQITADFISDKSEYVAGDIVKLTNKSTNANTYKWTLPDGKVTTATHVDYPIFLSQKDSLLTFKLEAVSKNQKETDEVLKSFIVKTNTVTFDGYTYYFVELPNGQAWMAENLRTSVYANGDPIPNVTDGTQWSNLTTGAWAHYDNNSTKENPYGKLYNWYTVADPRNVCPSGWHVPTDAEWMLLSDYLGGEDVAGGKMKSTSGWNTPNTNASNSSGFSGLPGGVRYDDGSFYNIGNYGNWWSSTEGSASSAWTRYLYYNIGVVGSLDGSKGGGSSVRCLRD
jgi:uncharacterized protein (TIGR02145 family)